MSANENINGDSGLIAQDIMEGVPEEVLVCQAIASSVESGSFTLEEAIEDYDFTMEKYVQFKDYFKA